MPDDKVEANQIWRKYYGNPEGLAEHLARICLIKTGVVYEVFVILDNFSTLDVGCRFINKCDYFQLVKTRKGLFLCRQLYKWLTEIRSLPTQPMTCVNNATSLLMFKAAIDSAPPPQNDKEENPYYTIDAGIVLTDEAIKLLDEIGIRYFKRVGKKFNVNSGTRTPLSQATAMLGVIEAGDRNLSKYGNRQAANEILNAYRTGRTREERIKKMTEVIQGQVSRNIFISNHLRAGGIDIATVGDVVTGVPRMSAAEEKIMIEIAKEVTRGQAFKEMFPEHIHIQYK